MSISIEDYNLPYETHNRYDVALFDDRIHTLASHSEYMVDTWISETYRIHHRRLHRLIVGFDVEWRPNFNRRYRRNPIATIQLCVGRRCLVFQVMRSPTIPQSLCDFLDDGRFTFVGVGIHGDVEKLEEDYGLSIANAVDLRSLAAEELNIMELRNASLKTLAAEVLGKDVEKPRRVTLSSWDNECLTDEQVQYACIDAFLSFEIGRMLNA